MRLLKTKIIRTNLAKSGENPCKIHVSARLLVKIRVSQVYLDPMQNRIAARSAHLEVAYLEALLYTVDPLISWFHNLWSPLFHDSVSGLNFVNSSLFHELKKKKNWIFFSSFFVYIQWFPTDEYQYFLIFRYDKYKKIKKHVTIDLKMLFQ